MVDLAGAIPAMPLLLSPDRRVDWVSQRALLRYYLDAGVSGLAVGVHTTQFELHADPGLLHQVWALAAEQAAGCGRSVTLVAGVCGDVPQATAEAAAARSLGYQAALLCASGMADVSEPALLAKAAAVGRTLPGIGFYLQESVGGRYLSAEFWQAMCELDSVIGIKTAPFDRYRTRDAVEAILRSDRWAEIAFLTGNDDNIVADLVTPHRLAVAGTTRVIHCRGGLLGQFAVGTRAAVQLTAAACGVNGVVPAELLAQGAALTAANAAIFDVRNGFAGCVAGVNEVLRQQGLAASALCLSDHERLSTGQRRLIEQARADYPELLDEEFIAENRDRWFSD